MEQWIYHLYKLIIAERAEISDIRSYVCNSGDMYVEWIESDTYPEHDDTYRYGSLDRLIKHALHYKLRKK